MALNAKCLLNVTFLIDEELKYNELLNNYTYLTDVKLNTTNTYNQILDSANTLLDILKNKCDGI